MKFSRCRSPCSRSINIQSFNRHSNEKFTHGCHLIAGIVVGLAVIWFFQISRIRFDVAATHFDPAIVPLRENSQFNVRSTSTPDQIQFGMIDLRDGHSVKFWFISHHLSPNQGCTRLDFPGGGSVYMTGEFCCEIQIPDHAAMNQSTLRKFITAQNGTPP